MERIKETTKTGMNKRIQRKDKKGGEINGRGGGYLYVCVCVWVGRG